MKNVKVYKQNQLISDQNLYEDPTEFVNHIVGTNYFGKPERWVRAKVAVPPDHDGRTGYFVYPDEQYDDEDVIGTEERNTGKTVLDMEGNPMIGGDGLPLREAETWVQLRAEYTIEVSDYVYVPQVITGRQARLALNHFSLRDAVEAAIASADQNTKDEWEYANEIRRDWASLIAMATAIGITSEQLDELFIYGGGL
jgi:hypothetical protein